ncbi:hypothetical protein [Azospirillum sp. TSO35-2]|uniref:hypothetical protein n=1 Tax=Azospirillum sp. TSO35-2 TaxID=716796 RepID=UPI001FFEC3D1|nr:hypothetical protein [Azospirillum sp. TSO35-2]
MRMAMVVNALTGVLLLAAGNATQAVALWAAGLLFLNHAATHGLSLWAPGLDTRGRLSLLQGVALGVGALAVVVAAGRSIAGMTVPDAPLASLALLLALGVSVTAATLLFANRRGRLSARAIWLCCRKDVAPLAAALAGLAGVWLLDDGAPDALVGAVIAATLLPGAASAFALSRLSRKRSLR